MKNGLRITFILFVLYIVVNNPAINAQAVQTSWNIDFSGNPPFSPYCWAAAYTFERADGMLKVTATDHPWDRFVFWAKPFDLGAAPYCAFHIKADVAMPDFLISFKDTSGTSLDITFSVPAGTDSWTNIYLDLSSRINTLNYPILAEVQFYPGAVGNIWFDDFKMGEAARPAINPPTLTHPEDMLVFRNSGEQSVTLKGITDGDPDAVQTISVTAVSTNTGIIPNPGVSALAGDSVVLTFTPVTNATGKAYIRITLKDNGAVANTTVDSFQVVVLVDGGTGYLQDFNTTVLPSEVSSLPGHSLSMSDNSLRVDANRSQRWYGVDYDLGAVVDISDNPYLNVRIRAEQDFIMQAFLIDFSGKGYAIEAVGSQYLYNELVAGANYFDQNRIYAGDEFIDVLFNFTGVDPGILDLTRINSIKFVGNGTSLTFEGTYYIDELSLGDQARPLSYVGKIPDQTFYINTTGTQKILVPEIKNTESIQVSGAGSLIENLTVDEITYDAHSENDRPVIYGHTWINFSLKNGASGSGQVTLTSTGKSGFEDNTCHFLLTISANEPPVIDPIDSMVTNVSTESVVMLSGISDGDRDVEQSVTLSASSSNTGVIETIGVEYADGSRYGKVKFTPVAPGEAIISLSVKDVEGAEAVTSFKVRVFTSLNASPVIDQVEKQTILNNAGQQTIVLTGIGDGDGTDQHLSITATASGGGIISTPVISYTQGATTAELTFIPVSTVTGAVGVTVTVTDNGGTADNDGDKSREMIFEVETVRPGIRGYVVNLADPNARSWFSSEGEGQFVWTKIVDTLGVKALRITYKEKWTYAGTWFSLPQELDISNTPVVSYDILSVGTESWHWNYLYHVHGTDGNVDRNIQNSEANQHRVPANVRTTVSFDYRDPGDLNNGLGEPIDASRINALLINWHNTRPAWPFTNTSGVIYYTNIRFGDSAVYEVNFPATTIDPIADQAFFENSGTHIITLTGISNGNGSTEGVAVSVGSATFGQLPDLDLGEINPDGTIDLIVGATGTCRVKVDVTISHPTSETSEESFIISIMSSRPDGMGNIHINLEEEHQTIRGMGTYEVSPRFASLYAEDMGASAVRIGIIGRPWEDVNDNNNPMVLNKEGFNYAAFDWEYYRDLKARGVEVFLLTSWSPPAWMKRNLSTSHKEQAIEWEKTDNILEPYYYDEFAESMVAVVKAFREEADIDLLAIGLQNEPYFNEPYPSAVLSGEKFAELIGIVGERFAAEGLGHVGFFMPEQVFGIGWNGYSNEEYLTALKANPEADAYCSYFAVHGYDQTGVNSDFPGFAGWTSLWEDVQTGNNPKEMWMTETYVGYNDDFDNAISVAMAIHGSLWAGNISLWTNWSFESMQLSNNSPTPIFYVCKNYFRYIRPGAVRVTTTSDYPDVVATAFKNTDGSTAIVVINKGALAAPIRFAGNNLPEQYTMYRTSEKENCLNAGTYNLNDGPVAVPGNAVVTFVAATSSILTMDQVADVHVLANSGESEVEITGISNGTGSTDGLSLDMEIDRPGLFSQISVSAVGANGTANLSFTPATDMAGIAKITLHLSDASQNTRNVTFYIIVEFPEGIVEPGSNEVLVYPVPASDHINVSVDKNIFDQVFVRDISGRVWRQFPVTSSLITIDISDMQKGAYLLELRGRSKTDIKKFIIQ